MVFFCRCIFPTAKKFSVVAFFPRQKNFLSFQTWNDKKKKFCRFKLGTIEKKISVIPSLE
jgi:hypothetical protein